MKELNCDKCTQKCEKAQHIENYSLGKCKDFKEEKMKIIVDERKYYVELDGINLIYEDGELVGWYRPAGDSI